MTPTDRPSKREAFLAFLKDGWVTVYIDARRPGVAVPDHLRNETRLVLQYGLNMPVPVEDLDVAEEGVKATLSFSRQPWQTLIPWSAIYVIACTDGRGVLYQEDVPSELMTTFAGMDEADDAHDGPKLPRKPAAAVAMVPTSQAPDEGSAPVDEPASPRSRLKSVPMPEAPKGDATLADFDDDDDDGDSPAPKGRPRLTLVKP